MDVDLLQGREEGYERLCGGREVIVDQDCTSDTSVKSWHREEGYYSPGSEWILLGASGALMIDRR